MNTKLPPTIAIFRDQPAEGWPSMDRYGLELTNSLYKISSRLNIAVHIPPKPWPIPRGIFWRRILHYPLWVKQYQGDVNHVLDHSYGHLLFGLNPQRTIVTVHDIAPILFPGHRLGLSGLAWRWAWRGAMRARYIITDSEFMRQTLLTQFGFDPQRVITVHIAVNPFFRVLPVKALIPFRQSYHLSNMPLLLHVGSTQPRKNIENLLLAIGHLHQIGYEVELIQVGGAPTTTQFSMIQTLGIQDHVRFLGRVSDEDLLALYNLADIFTFPSFYEGFGLPVLEAMACGTVVIAANTSSLPEIVGDAGLLIDSQSPQDIAQVVTRVLDDSDLQKELQQQGIQRSQKFSWTTTAQKTAKVYERVLLER